MIGTNSLTAGGATTTDIFLNCLEAKAKRYPGVLVSEHFYGTYVSAKAGTRRTIYRVGFYGKGLTKMACAEKLLVIEGQSSADRKREEATVHMEAEVNYVEGRAPHVTLKGKRLLHQKGTYNYYHVGAVGRGCTARKECGGPMVEGPWAYAFQIATVLSDSKAHQVREADERAAALDVETGSLIWVDGVQYRVEFDRHDHVKLVPVDNDNQPCMMPGVGLHNAAPPSRRRA